LRNFFLSPESTHNLFLSLPQNLKSHAGKYYKWEILHFNGSKF